MPKSKKRGGKKAHNKRIQKRKQEISNAKKRIQEEYSKLFEQKILELKEQNPENNNETIQSEENNQIIDPTI